MPNIMNDQRERELAINPSQSFIVQAPAGSGKTELLIQRFLQLLSHTEKNPEEIIAITFTRKAAAEMQQRVIDALVSAKSMGLPEQPHKKITWQLAQNALKRDKLLHWNLIENPNRLRIFTIDALATYLVRQMPISSQLSPNLNMIDKPRLYYQEAVETILLRLIDNPPWKSEIQTLLLHLDNRVTLLENLLIEILSKREQWLPHITGYQNNSIALRKHMDDALRNVAIENLQLAMSLLSDDTLAELIPLANFAGQYCTEQNPDNPIAHCNTLNILTDEIELLPAWFGITHMLLTQKGEWRKSVTKRQGFVAKSKLKSQMIAFLKGITNNEALRQALHNIMQLPPLSYDEQQWNIIQSLLEILPILAAQLNLIFSRDNVNDFVELNLAALRALGDAENPTDLAMHLDYRINHLLIDEFQDTSILQFQLIEKLIEGWQPGDGRTLFLVGDPMQSIYRFRNAEVGLFLRAQQQGIANISLQSLKLTQNFRSEKAIVEWNNENFSTIFPKETDIMIGAASYSPAQTEKSHGGHIQWHPSFNDDGNLEASEVVKVIQHHQENTPDDSIAILVRSRSHLYTITERLHQENIPFQAVELEPLAELKQIRDIHTLMRALLHYADRIAWLAVLRAPYCGLTLKDLYGIAQAANHKTIWSTLKNKKLLMQLSDDARIRLQHCLPTFHHAIDSKGRLPLSQILRTLWIELGGPDTLSNKQQEINIEHYIQLIEILEIKSTPVSLNDIDEQLNNLYAEPIINIDTTLQIMTIHKAKGLEFDHVLLPGLHRKPSYDRQQILKWLEKSNRQRKSDLILAPIKAVKQQYDPIYTYLKRIEKNKADLEYVRLLYVAATRAKKSLHLFANIIDEDDTFKLPAKGSFLQLLWHQAKPHFQNRLLQPHTELTVETRIPTLHRFTQAYLKSQPIPTHKETSNTQPANISITNSNARQFGIFIHNALEQLTDQKSFTVEQWQKQFQQAGVPKAHWEIMLQQIHKVITQMQQDPRGQWILSNQHQDAHCELPLTFFDGGTLKNIIIDRTFIDEQGTRWIIDYKTAIPTDTELEKYQEQLDTYARAMHLREQRPIQLGLYFPLNGQWLEWSFF